MKTRTQGNGDHLRGRCAFAVVTDSLRTESHGQPHTRYLLWFVFAGVVALGIVLGYRYLTTGSGRRSS